MISILIYLFHSFDLSAHPYPNLLHYLSRVYLFAFDDETCDRPKRSAIQRGKPFFGTV